MHANIFPHRHQAHALGREIWLSANKVLLAVISVPDIK